MQFAALAPFHPRLRGFPLTCRSSGKKLLCAPEPFSFCIGEIDLLAEVLGLGSFEEVKKHSIGVDAFERQIMTLGLPALIRAKRAAGREKDLSALAELESLLEASES